MMYDGLSYLREKTVYRQDTVAGRISAIADEMTGPQNFDILHDLTRWDAKDS